MSIEREIQRELTRLDSELWLDKVSSPLGYVYYAVKYGVGVPDPWIVLEWRDGMGPYPLSLSIVEAVRRQEGDIRDTIKEVTVNNAVLKEKRRQENQQAYEDIAKEFHQRSKKHYVLPPKGVKGA